MSEVADVLDSAAKTAADVAKYSPPPVDVIAGIVAVALKAGAAIARSGQDPLVEITRVLDRNPHVARVRGEWDAFIDANWPVGRRKTEPPPVPGSDVGMDRHPTEPSMPAVTDPYEDED